MKRARSVLSTVLFASVILLPLQAVSAETVAVSDGSITVRSEVAKTHYILIDASGTITQITSNTKEGARPRVFFQSIAPGNERPISDKIYRQYQAIIPTGKTRTVGIIYTQSEVARLPLFSASNTKADTYLPSFMKQKF